MVSKKLFKKKNKVLSFVGVHSSINSIINWDTDVEFFIKLDVFRTFGVYNHNRLKNIFCKVIEDTFFWEEIEKMIRSNNVNICSDVIYVTKYNMSFSVLSRFLLDLYLTELDYYIDSISSEFNNRVNLFLGNVKSLNSKTLVYYLSNVVPLKLEKVLSSVNKLRKLNFLVYDIIKQYYIVNFFKPRVRFFSKKMFYTRFLHFCLLGIKSSLEFARVLRSNIINFSTTNLHLEFSNSNLFLSCDKNIFYLGFNLRLINEIKNNVSSNSSTFLLIDDQGKNSVNLRLSKYRNKVTNLFVDRYKIELSSYINRSLKAKGMIVSSFQETVFWTYLFQLESIRSSQFNKFIGSSDNLSLLTNNVFSSFKCSSNVFLTYNKYSLKAYISKLRFLLHQTMCKVPSFFNISIYPLDLKLISLLDDLERTLFVYNQKVNKDFFHLRDLSESFQFKFLFANLDNKNFFRLQKLYSNSRSFKLKNLVFLGAFVPTKFCFEKFRNLGFMHPFKNRPMGNPSFLSLEDSSIIKSFGYVGHCFLTWFRCSDNFIKAKFLVEFMRQSCFLTLCRKHNKAKNWVYSVYTPDLLLVRSFFGNKSFFPSRRSISIMKKKFFFDSRMFLDEKFFL